MSATHCETISIGTVMEPSRGIEAKALTTNPATICPNAQGFNEGLSTGLPKPQYVPLTNPWLYGGNLFHKNAKGAPPVYDINETYTCFGSYLPCSTAQVRRTAITNYGNMTKPINVDKVPTFVIQNLKYTGYQTILSDEITSAILRSAAKEDVFDFKVKHGKRIVPSQQHRVHKHSYYPLKSQAQTLSIVFSKIQTCMKI